MVQDGLQDSRGGDEVVLKVCQTLSCVPPSLKSSRHYQDIYTNIDDADRLNYQSCPLPLHDLNPSSITFDGLIRSTYGAFCIDSPVSLTDAKLHTKNSRVQGENRQPIWLTNPRFPSLGEPFLQQ